VKEQALMTPTMRLTERMRPEVGAGGFTRIDGTVEFYGRVNALLRPNMTVVDLGAGRGQFLEDACTYRRNLQYLKGKVHKVIGIDVDLAVAENAAIDEYFVVAPGAPLPLEDRSIDLIVSDWVLEHVDNPISFSAEILRVLKPGGWFCARTPNKWGMVGIAARFIPNNRHVGFLRRLQPHRQEKDVFPVRYRLNTRSDVRRFFPAPLWYNYTYCWNAEPTYHAERETLWRLMSA